MYIAMNRFKIANKHTDDFLKTWEKRDRYLDSVAGFKDFKLLRGPQDDASTVFISHSVWESQQAFKAWRDSESFTKAHADARSPKGTHLEHPKFEGYEVILEK